MALKDEIERSMADAESGDLQRYIGNDWWELSEAEMDVLEIDLARWPRMMMAWAMFEAFLDVGDGLDDEPLSDALEAERARRPDIVELGYGEPGFDVFARAYAGLTMREAHITFVKMDLWNIRTGVTVFRDEE